MQQPQRTVEHVHEHGTRRLAVVGIGICAEPNLDRLEIPIGELVPHEAARGLRELVEAHPRGSLLVAPHAAVRGGETSTLGRLERPDSGVALRNRHIETVEDPRVGEREASGIDLGDRPHRCIPDIREEEASDVPQLRCEVAARRKRLLDVGRIQDDIGAESKAGDQRPAECVGAEE